MIYMGRGKLDLHGVRHHEVIPTVENFVLMNQDVFPLAIVCGNSVKMVQLVEQTLNDLGCKFQSYRFGAITIGGFL